MELRRFANAQELVSACGDFLLRYEAENNLILGILAGLAHEPIGVYLAAVFDGTMPLQVSVMTPPHNLVLSRGDGPEALSAVAQDTLRLDPQPPGVLGQTGLVRGF